MSKRHILSALIVGICAISANAQTESTLYFMNSLPQVVEANPAIMPKYKLSIGLPGISSFGGVYSNNGFSYNDLVTKKDGISTIDLSNWTKGLADKNYISLTGFTDLLRVGIRINPKLYVMLSSTVKGYNRTMIPKGLASVLVDGTAPIVGSYSNTSPQQESIAFLSTNVGAAYQLNDKLTIGGRIKYLNGLVNITTQSSSLILQVDDNYQITATGDALVRSSGVANLNKSGYDARVGDYLKNSGWGLDIGATYQFMEKLTLGASLTDFGYVKWKNNTVEYRMDPSKARYVFSGFDVNKLLDDTGGNYLDQQLDSIESKFEMKESTIGSYTTMLPGKLYLSGNYELMKNLSVGALFFTEKFRDRTTSGLTANVNKHFGKWVSASLSYTVSNRSYNNIGAGVSFNLAPIQLYIVGDNLLRAPASLIANQNLNSFVNSSQLLSVRAGLNIVLGWEKGATAPTKVEDDSHNPREKKSAAKVKTTFGRSPQKKSTNSKRKKPVRRR